MVLLDALAYDSHARLDLMISLTVVEMFLIPRTVGSSHPVGRVLWRSCGRMVRDVVSLLHPDKLISQPLASLQRL